MGNVSGFDPAEGIKQARAAYSRQVRRSISQIEADRLCGWEGQTRIGQYEAGFRTPELLQAAVIARAFGTTIDAIAFPKKREKRG